MKKSAMALGLLVAGMGHLWAQEAIPEPEIRPDLQEEIAAPEPAAVPQAPETPQVTIVIEEEEPRRKKYRIRTCKDMDVEIGFSNWFTGAFDIVGANNEPYTLSPIQSLYLAVNRDYTTYLPGPFAFKFGLGISGQGFAFQDATTTVDNSAAELEFVGNNPVIGEAIHSQLGMMHVNTYLVPMLDIGKLEMGVGVYGGYRLLTATTRVFSDESGDWDYDRSSGNFGTLPFRYGLRAVMGVQDAQVFANYDLTETFYRDRGPHLRTFSVGVIL